MLNSFQLVQKRFKKTLQATGRRLWAFTLFSQLSLTPGYCIWFSWEKMTQLCSSYSTFCQMIQKCRNARETECLLFLWLWSVKVVRLFQHKVYYDIATFALFIKRNSCTIFLKAVIRMSKNEKKYFFFFPIIALFVFLSFSLVQMVTRNVCEKVQT